MPFPSSLGYASVRSSATLTNPGITTHVRAGRAPLLVGRGEEEHVHPLHERARVVVVRVVPDEQLLDAHRQARGVELVLKLAVAVVKHAPDVTPGDGHSG